MVATLLQNRWQFCSRICIIQQKVLSPNDFNILNAVEERLLQFQEHYERIAKPFKWKFTREDLTKMLKKISKQPEDLALLA